MKEIIKENGSVFCNEGAWPHFNKIIEQLNPSKIFVLVDQNTQEACLPYFKSQIASTHFELISIPSGETSKNIHACLAVWQILSNNGADRKSLLVNLGGGVVTDLGGFVACTYQRGISFINVPTSLLAMVDASVGGKNGVDLGSLKNQIGIIQNPKAVIVDTQFLHTLPKEHMRSGMAEMIKHGFIKSETYLLKSFNFNHNSKEDAASLIWESVNIKNNIISQDPNETGIRKTLNFGHTLGHAIESYFLKNPKKPELLHGEAIAIGMVLALYISSELTGFPKEKCRLYSQKIILAYGKTNFSQEDIAQIIKLLIFDKKNSHGKVQFVLLTHIGVSKLNCIVPEKMIYDAFKFYKLCAAE